MRYAWGFLLLASCSAAPADPELRLLQGSTEARNEILERRGPEAVRIFARHLGAEAGAARLPAIQGLAVLAEERPEALAALLPLLKDPSRDIRFETLAQLCFRGLPDVQPALVALSSDPDAAIRELALDELDRVDQGDIRSVFEIGARDPDP
ncbi:MAG: HEAT repeat domain-containing protein, partial [Planctomycetaceae bacterium]|nr:HEAT repeat domain-containing protein [Planctomycetaceae bacterium]